MRGGEYKSFAQITRERLLHEMLQLAKTGDPKSKMKVLIVDKVTLKVMSCTCKMSDLVGEGVTFVEVIHMLREPRPEMDAIYFIQPTKENVAIFLSDMCGGSPLYRKAFVFFSSPIAKELEINIRRYESVVSRIAALREMNLEYFAIDSQGFVTDNDRALMELFVDEASSRKVDACLNLMAARLATVFASLGEFPFVRYRADQSVNSTTMTTFRDLIPTRFAAVVWDGLMKYKENLENFPKSETCQLLILDRSVDPIAPFIHDWTFDAMCHDLLDIEGNEYIHEVLSRTGVPEKKKFPVGDHDPIWLELRHEHIAYASEQLSEKMKKFVSRSKVARVHSSGLVGNGIEPSTRDIQMMVHYLPQFEKLSLHVDIAEKINKIIRELGLADASQLEQDLVFGDAETKNLINFLRIKEDSPCENKLRLLMIYAALFPEKFESGDISKLMELARLSPDDMTAVYNMRLLVTQTDTEETSSLFPRKLHLHKKRHAARKDRPGEEMIWKFSRFYPLIEELIEKLCKGELSPNDYPCINEPSPTSHETSQPSSSRAVPPPDRHSWGSRRTPTWARAKSFHNSDLKKMGRRVFVFIIGGATRSELRVCHEMSKKLNREIILGSSSIDTPRQFITKLKQIQNK